MITPTKELIRIMRELAADKENICGDKWHISWCDEVADKLEELGHGMEMAVTQIMRDIARDKDNDAGQKWHIGWCNYAADVLEKLSSTDTTAPAETIIESQVMEFE